ncbi:DUF3472 domain-containing protein [Candidatus Sodalis endolongispinus]|uniref:DUF3472 domain-containing protein n=1 Tax=Candidatus Sodalis endolongispinus TaxID=2812662 RepID=A0ABS5Y7U2_9GAMM|nr:DUF3472 domain-containing protein [Candidatus Sodalis endolongispinus]MBT9431059.1 DUF3472 domain-containing protein [Candidatus Sodalis endolongispinus]
MSEFPYNLTPSSGHYVNSVFHSTYTELIYTEQYITSEGDAENIYWSTCNFYFGKRGGYAGLQHKKDSVIEGVPFVYNNIFSVWDEKETQPGEPTEVKLEYACPGLYSNRFGGEGTGLHTSHPMPWKTNQWYATAIRRWYIQGEDVTHAGMFMYSYETKKWTHYSSVIIPEKDILITDGTICGFLERFGGNALGYHGIYGQHFKMHPDGSWEKPLYYKASAGGSPRTWNAESVNSNTNINLIAGGDFENDKEEKEFKINQFDDAPKPTKAPGIDAFSAELLCDILKVSCTVDDGLSPQLSYTIEVREEKVNGAIVAQESKIIPHQRLAYIKLPQNLMSGKYFVTLKITSIFNDDSDVKCSSFEVNNSIYPVWDKSTTYQHGDRVTWDNSDWEAKWWNVGQEPQVTTPSWASPWLKM